MAELGSKRDDCCLCAKNDRTCRFWHTNSNHPSRDRWYRYNDNDELLVRDHSVDPVDIQVCRRHRDVAMAHAIPFAEFIRRVRLT